MNNVNRALLKYRLLITLAWLSIIFSVPLVLINYESDYFIGMFLLLILGNLQLINLVDNAWVQYTMILRRKTRELWSNDNEQ